MEQEIYNKNLNKVNIKCIIKDLNFDKILTGEITQVSDNLIKILNDKIIFKYDKYNYYIEGEYGDYLPSPFSNANTVNFIIPNILYNILNYNTQNSIINIKFYSNSKKFDFFDNTNYPSINIKIINLNI